jgi:hypothetical protein
MIEAASMRAAGIEAKQINLQMILVPGHPGDGRSLCLQIF